MSDLARLLPFPIEEHTEETEAALVGKLTFLKELGRDLDAVAMLRHVFGHCEDLAWSRADVEKAESTGRTVTYYVYVPKLVDGSALRAVDDGSLAAGSTVAGDLSTAPIATEAR